jgi:hypothetical protein
MKYRLNSEGTLEEIKAADHEESYKVKAERERESLKAVAEEDVPVPIIIPRRWSDPCNGELYIGCEQKAAEKEVHTGQYL